MMRPRYAADYRTLLWVFMLTPLCLGVQYARPELVPYTFWISAYFALACGVIAHNHNHCPTFAKKGVNHVFANWISIFYGYPTFAWIPTHNLNHHKYVNRAGDATITWRHTPKHNALVAIAYPFVSSYFQSDPINAFIRKARAKNPKLYRTILLQYAVWGGAHLLLLALAIALHGYKTGFFVWVMVNLVPAVFALWTIMWFNYVQHVHTDPWSKHNHSRSFDGKLINFLLFNNGLHAAHHENPGTHWSKLPEAHSRIAREIDPRLCHTSMWAFAFRQYLLAPIFPRLGTSQVGRAPYDPPDGKVTSLESGDVEVGDAGTNAQMLEA
jgi:fatty acid desaturase